MLKGNSDQPAGTYEWDDMGSCEISDNDSSKRIDFVDGSCTVTVDEDVVTEIAQKKPYYAVFRDSSMANDSVAANFEQIFATYSPQTVRKVL